MTQSNLDQAKARYAEGDLDQAESMLRHVLAGDPENAETLYWLGLIAMDRGAFDSAIGFLKHAVGRNPTHVEALTALGVTFVRAGFPAKATTILAEAVKTAPGRLDSRLHLARAYSAALHPEQALHVLDRTIEDFPKATDAWVLKGRLAREMDRPGDAYTCFCKAAELEPESPAIKNDLGVAYRALGQLDDAEVAYRAAIALDADLAVAHANLGNVLELKGETRAAETHLRLALELDPATPDAAYNLACLLTKVEQPEEALPIFEAVASEAPGRWDVLTNLGVTYLALGQLDESETALRRSLELNPKNPEAHYNLAWLLLLTDRYEEGWRELEWRWQLPDFSARQPDYEAPLWDGSDLRNGSLILHAEQGLGDTIQFIRFASSLKPNAGKVILSCQPGLTRLLKNQPAIDGVRAFDDAPIQGDAYATLLSLPRLLDTRLPSIPKSAGYIGPPPGVKDRLRVPDTGRKRIGLVWAGSPDNKIDRRRAMTSDQFLPLFEATNADFVSLQVGPAAAGVNVFPDDRVAFKCDSVVKDFMDTATVVSQLDLVIGVDTSVIHLSGAMAVPTWVVLPFMPDYRWGLGRDSSPWYDSVRLFRQPARGNWDAVIADLCDALRSW